MRTFPIIVLSCYFLCVSSGIVYSQSDSNDVGQADLSTAPNPDNPDFSVFMDVSTLTNIPVEGQGLFDFTYWSFALGLRYRYPLFRYNFHNFEFISGSLYPGIGIGMNSLLELQFKVKLLSFFTINFGIAHQVYFTLSHTYSKDKYYYKSESEYRWKQKQIGQQLVTIIGYGIELKDLFFIEITLRNPWLDTPAMYETSVIQTLKPPYTSESQYDTRTFNNSLESGFIMVTFGVTCF